MKTKRTGISIIGGIVLGTVLALTAGYANTVFADDEGDFCPDPGGCPGGYCFTRGDGQKSCKYWGSLPECPSSCQQYPIIQ